MNLDDIEDDVIYTLTDVERSFSISKMKLIKCASLEERKIRLCIPLEQYHEVNLINLNELIDPLAKSRMNAHLAPQYEKFSNFKTVNKYQIKNAISIIIPLEKCVLYRSDISLECTFFDEVYLQPLGNNENSTIQVKTALEYAEQLNLAITNRKFWVFAVYPLSIIPPQNSWEPRLYNISRDDLCIYGFELRNYLLDKATTESKTTEITNNSPKNKATRDDPFRLEMKLAIEFLLKKGKNATPSTVMAYLKSKAGHDGCAITRIDDKEGVWWLNSSGVEEYIDNKNLKNRLTYLRKSNPELFATQPK